MSAYKNKIIVAPMVRISTLPFRLLCLDYGADLVYTDETIDFKMLRTERINNDVLGTIDFIDKTDGTVFFRTCAREKDKMIFQLGTCSAQRALKVAKLVEDCVAGIDINMGCPKEFSIKGGMGAALLTQPEKVKDILSTLTKNLSVPITCKIRILPSLEDTLSLCKLIQSCGVSAVAIHGRTRNERPSNANHNDFIKKIAQALSIPVIANGGSKGMESREDILKFKEKTGSSSVMVARSAMWNCSILRKEGKLPPDTVITEYLKYCVLYDNTFTYTKYTVQNILRDLQSTGRGKAFLEAQTLQEICALWGLKDYFNDQVLKNSSAVIDSKSNTRACVPQSIDDVILVTKDEAGAKLFEMPLYFIRGNYGNADLPKMILNNYVYKKGLKGPKFSCQGIDKYFLSNVDVDGVKYGSSIKEKSRRYSEQGSALVCLHVLGLVDKAYGFVPSVGTRKYVNYSSNLSFINNENSENGSLGEPLEKKSRNEIEGVS